MIDSFVNTVEYHQVPQRMIDITVNIYDGVTKSVVTKTYTSIAIKFEMVFYKVIALTLSFQYGL